MQKGERVHGERVAVGGLAAHDEVQGGEGQAQRHEGLTGLARVRLEIEAQGHAGGARRQVEVAHEHEDREDVGVCLEHPEHDWVAAAHVLWRHGQGKRAGG